MVLDWPGPEGAPGCKPRRPRRTPRHPAMSGGACSVRVLSGGAPAPPEHVTRATSGRAIRGSIRSGVVLLDRRDCRGRRRRSASPRASVLKRRTPAMEGALGRRRSSSLTRRRAESALVPAKRGGHIPSSAGATESVRGRIKTLAPGRQRRSVQGASLEETEATGSSGSSDAGLLGKETESHL